MKNIVSLLAACCFLVLISVFSSSSADATVVTIRKEAVVESEIVRLRDVAAISEAPEEERGRLEAIEICAAPPPAQSQILGASDITLAIAHAKMRTQSVTLTGSSETLVKRDYALVEPEELTESVYALIIKKTGWPRETFLVEPPKNFSPIAVPAGERKILVSLAPEEQLPGNINAVFDIIIAGKSYQKISHRFQVEQYLRTLVATSKLRRGQPAEDGSFEFASIERSRIDGSPVTSRELLEGKNATRTIYPGTPISSELFAAPPILQRGETAPAILHGSGFSIETTGKLLDDGYVNEIVRIRLPSRKVVKALVTDAGVLKISD
jgi:flagella basal body P-ring formation protein FlgA